MGAGRVKTFGAHLLDKTEAADASIAHQHVWSAARICMSKSKQRRQKKMMLKEEKMMCEKKNHDENLSPAIEKFEGFCIHSLNVMLIGNVASR